MKIFYLVLFKSLLLSFVSACDLAMPHFFGLISARDSKCHISVNSQPIDSEFNLGAYIYVIFVLVV